MTKKGNIILEGQQAQLGLLPYTRKKAHSRLTESFHTYLDTRTHGDSTAQEDLVVQATPVNQGNPETSSGLVVERAQVEPAVQVGPTTQVDLAGQGGELASVDLATPLGHVIQVDLGVQHV